MHPEHYTDLDNFDTVETNLRHSAKGSNDAYDVTDSLTPAMTSPTPTAAPQSSCSPLWGLVLPRCPAALPQLTCLGGQQPQRNLMSHAFIPHLPVVLDLRNLDVDRRPVVLRLTRRP